MEPNPEKICLFPILKVQFSLLWQKFIGISNSSLKGLSLQLYFLCATTNLVCPVESLFSCPPFLLAWIEFHFLMPSLGVRHCLPFNLHHNWAKSETHTHWPWRWRVHVPSKHLLSAYRTAWDHIKKTTVPTAVITSKHIGIECTLKVVGHNFSLHAFSCETSLHDA
jgi:hypothetical protein